jgi:Flp pilus assembly protein TadG
MSLFRKTDPRRGAAAVEFALVLPMLLVLFVGTAEVMLYLRAAFRLERVAAEVANAGTQLDAVTRAEVQGLFDAANLVAQPLRAWTTPGDPPIAPRARTFISVVSGSPSGNSVAWSCARGDADRSARIVVNATTATLPNGFQVPPGQTVMVVEVVSTIRSWFLFQALFGVAGPPEIRTHAIMRPRQAQLSSLPAGECPA